jgi:hypothetical protein
VRVAAAAILAALALAAPAAAASDEPICHGQYAPPTAAEQEQAAIQEYMRLRAELGFRADEAYVRELIRRGVWEYDVGYIPVTPAENDYLRLRDRLDLGRKAKRYLHRRRDLFAGLSIEDDWPREPYLLVRVTRDRAAHESNLQRLARFPDNLRTVQVRYSLRALRRVGNRIGDDYEALKHAGFELTQFGADIVTNTVGVSLITERTDAAAYFRDRYGPVTVQVIATEPTFLDCEDAFYYEISGDGRGVTIHWDRAGGVTPERIDVTEHPDRVEVGVVDRVPHGGTEDMAVHERGTVRLAQPLGERPVVDMADGRRLLQHGPGPGEPPCPVTGPLRRLENAIAARREHGLPHGRAYVRRMLRRKDPYTKAEHAYLRIRETLEIAVPVFRYEDRHADEFGGTSIEDHYPAKPVLVERFTGHLRRHTRNLRRLMKYPELLRVVRARWTERELAALAGRILDDADGGDGFVGGFGDAGFYVEHAYADPTRTVALVRTPRTDAARYFRSHYGPAVKVLVIGRRYECRETR